MVLVGVNVGQIDNGLLPQALAFAGLGDAQGGFAELFHYPHFLGEGQLRQDLCGEWTHGLG